MTLRICLHTSSRPSINPPLRETWLSVKGRSPTLTTMVGTTFLATGVRYVLLYATILRLHTSFYHENSSPASFIHLTNRTNCIPCLSAALHFVSQSDGAGSQHAFHHDRHGGQPYRFSLQQLASESNPRALEKTCRQPMMHICTRCVYMESLHAGRAGGLRVPTLAALVGAVQRPSRFPPTPRRIGFADFGINIGADSAACKASKAQSPPRVFWLRSP